MGMPETKNLSDDEKNELIKTLTEEKGSLLKIISHDIRGPFNRIFALLQLFELESKEIPVELKEYIDKMYEAVIGGMEMVKNLHDSRAIDQGTLTFKPLTFELHQLIKSVIRGFNIRLRLKNMKVHFEEGENDIEITTDRILLNKVIENVFSNAIKFTPNNNTIILTTSLSEEKITIQVIDQGPGLTEEEIAKAFKKFQKLGPQPTGGESSTGLGLYNASVFMKMMGGKIYLERSDQSGLKVRLNLPQRPDTN
jgi:signal transduction histidine kinase